MPADAPVPPVVTRFAPSPTGYLHIGGARTALFNWLYARHTGGKFLLRIEDTDRDRSTPEATAAIFEGLRWLGLDWDGERGQPVRARRPPRRGRPRDAGARHRLSLLRPPSRRSRPTASGPRPRAAAALPLALARRRSRDRPDGPSSSACRARARARPWSHDVVQGEVTWRNENLDDLILLRSDGTPTYKLAVVVDDHDMGVTHVIRGDDHLNNAARQTLIYRAMDWEVPVLAHIPLIHGAGRQEALQAPRRPRGRGLPRHGLPARGHAQLPRPPGLEPRRRRVLHHRRRRSPGSTSAHLGKAPARFDFAKLENLSGQHIRAGGRRCAARRDRGLSCNAKETALDGRTAADDATRHARGERAREDHAANA